MFRILKYIILILRSKMNRSTGLLISCIDFFFIWNLRGRLFHLKTLLLLIARRRKRSSYIVTKILKVANNLQTGCIRYEVIFRDTRKRRNNGR